MNEPKDLAEVETPPLRRILVVDDDRDYRNLLLAFLRGAFPGVEVVEYDPAAAGVPGNDFDWSRFDVLILDYNLRMDGITGLDILQANHDGHSFPATIMLTGAGDEDVAVRAFKSGVHDYLRKERLKKSLLRDTILQAQRYHARQLQRLNALDSVREAARAETARMIAEYKTKFEEVRRREEARLKGELQRLEGELAQRQEALGRALAEKDEAGKARSAAEREIAILKVRLENRGTGDNAALETLRREFRAAQDKLARVENELAGARRRQEKAEAGLLKANWRKEQEEAIQQHLQEDLASFNNEIQEQEKNHARASSHLERMREVKSRLRAREQAEEKAQTRTLLGDVSSLLKKDK